VEELAPIPLVRRLDHLARESVELAGRRDRDGRGGRIEVAKLGRAGKICDAVSGRRLTKRREQVTTEFVALGLEPARRVAAAQRRGDRDGGLVALQRPEVIPVGVHRLGPTAPLARGPPGAPRTTP